MVEQEHDALPHAGPDLETSESVEASQGLSLAEFEALSLYDFLGQLYRAPRTAWAAFWAVARPNAPLVTGQTRLELPLSPTLPATTSSDIEGEDVPSLSLQDRLRAFVGDKAAASLALQVSAFVVGWWGAATLVMNAPERSEARDLAMGLPLLVLALLLWLTSEVVGHADALRAWWGRRRTPPELVPASTAEDAEITPSSDASAWYMRVHPLRLFLALGGSVAMAVTWLGTSGNQMPTPIFYAWLVSVACWSLAFAPRVNVRAWAAGWWARLTGFQPSQHVFVLTALVLIMALGASFRLTNLHGDPAQGTSIPQEMTSDHVEKLLDSQRVKEGSRNIFFANNGGREPFQMYAMALFSMLPNQGINHDSLKLLAVLESLVTLPVLFWLGLELFGRHDRRMGVLVGLALMALVAVSYWHVSITRLALRIVLTPLVTALLTIYLVRAMRGNHRADFIKAGLVLGFGLYTYQAARMLPLVVIVAVLLMLVWGVRRWRERAAVMVNFGVLIAVSFVVFLPLFHYSIEQPEQFWRRTAGRLLGDDVIEERLPDGRVVMRNATLEERFAAFQKNLPVLLNNVRNVLLMFHWKGDVAWINGAPNYPAMDVFSGALLFIGLGAWGVWTVRQRDASYALFPLAAFIMLMPSALSIAFPVENPSHTRTSGALPYVYAIAALPLALLVTGAWHTLKPRVLRVGVTASLAGLVVLGGYAQNSALYFGEFARSYAISSLPYSDAGRVLRGFAMSDGAWGNAYMIAYPYWWDHRAVGLAAGLEGFWINGVYDRDPNDALSDDVDYISLFMSEAYQRTDRFRYLPDRDLLFFYNVNDAMTSSKLKAWFPNGRELRYPSYQVGDDFMLYRVPALGLQGFLDFLTSRQGAR